MGSSPLARGPLTLDNASNTVSGLIPARAGTTPFLVCVFYWGVAHPRSRGDHATSCASSAVSAGSSPLARGPHAPHARYGVVTGLIPARAGTTHNNARTPARRGAHPRSRGDHVCFYSCAFAWAGSSPLARGPHGLARYSPGCMGLIPARAGTTCNRLIRRKPAGAHPRSRGDHGEPEAI